MSCYTVSKDTISSILTPLFYAMDKVNRPNINHDQLVNFGTVSRELSRTKRKNYNQSLIIKNEVLKTARIPALPDFFNSDMFNDILIDYIEFRERYPQGVNQFRHEKLTTIGRALMLINEYAFDHRYTNNVTGFAAGGYKFKNLHKSVSSKDNGRIKMYINAIGSCDCYLYQISEGDIDKTIVGHFIEQLRQMYAAALINCMSVVIPWGVE